MEAERRQVTILFTDMVGFTAFSERAGEEGAYTLMRSLSKLMDEAVNHSSLHWVLLIVVAAIGGSVMTGRDGSND